MSVGVYLDKNVTWSLDYELCLGHFIPDHFTPGHCSPYLVTHQVTSHPVITHMIIYNYILMPLANLSLFRASLSSGKNTQRLLQCVRL